MNTILARDKKRATTVIAETMPGLQNDMRRKIRRKNSREREREREEKGT